MGVKDLANAILTILSIVVIASAFHMRIEEGAASGSLVALSLLSFLYLILRYIQPTKRGNKCHK